MKTWKDYGIPDAVPQTIQKLRPGIIMDTLLHHVVMRIVKKPHFYYTCDYCHYRYSPIKANEEVCSCQNCLSKKVRCIQTLKPNDTKIPPYSRHIQYAENIISYMVRNYEMYFDASPKRNVDWTWEDNLYKVNFAEGESATGETPRLAICRASLMTPYLWDRGFDWKNFTPRDDANRLYLTDLFFHFMLSDRI